LCKRILRNSSASLFWLSHIRFTMSRRQFIRNSRGKSTHARRMKTLVLTTFPAGLLSRHSQFRGSRTAQFSNLPWHLPWYLVQGQRNSDVHSPRLDGPRRLCLRGWNRWPTVQQMPLSFQRRPMLLPPFDTMRFVFVRLALWPRHYSSDCNGCCRLCGHVHRIHLFGHWILKKDHQRSLQGRKGTERQGRSTNQSKVESEEDV